MNIADEIAKLNELKEKGILTEEEFQKAKEKLLTSSQEEKKAEPAKESTKPILTKAQQEAEKKRKKEQLKKEQKKERNKIIGIGFVAILMLAFANISSLTYTLLLTTATIALITTTVLYAILSKSEKKFMNMVKLCVSTAFVFVICIISFMNLGKTSSTDEVAVAEEVVKISPEEKKEEKAPEKQEEKKAEGKNWYEGGTLHASTVLEWKKGNSENKLATAADWLAVTDNIAADKVKKSKDVNDFKPYAEEMVTCVDTAVKGVDIIDHQEVSGVAALCAAELGYLK